jgi:hypothetical protein
VPSRGELEPIDVASFSKTCRGLSPCGRVKFSARKFWEGLKAISRN